MTSRGGLRSALWVAASYALLLFALASWRGWRHRDVFWPRSPFDNVNALTAQEWIFLASARASIPPGVSYTVLAEPLSREMDLFMMSYGLFPRSVPIPSSLWQNPLRSVGAKAQYVLASPCEAADRDQLRVVAKPEGGCVLIRERPPR